MDRGRYVFVSYCHRDSDAVLSLIDMLVASGVQLWYDSGIEVGSEWPEYIANSLSGASCVLSFMTPRSAESHNCRREINFAIENRIDVIVAYLEPTELTLGMQLQLNSLQAIFRDNYDSDEEFVAALLRAPALQRCIVHEEEQQPEDRAAGAPVPVEDAPRSSRDAGGSGDPEEGKPFGGSDAEGARGSDAANAGMPGPAKSADAASQAGDGRRQGGAGKEGTPLRGAIGGVPGEKPGVPVKTPAKTPAKKPAEAPEAKPEAKPGKKRGKKRGAVVIVGVVVAIVLAIGAFTALSQSGTSGSSAKSSSSASSPSSAKVLSTEALKDLDLLGTWQCVSVTNNESEGPRLSEIGDLGFTYSGDYYGSFFVKGFYSGNALNPSGAVVAQDGFLAFSDSAVLFEDAAYEVSYEIGDATDEVLTDVKTDYLGFHESDPADMLTLHITGTYDKSPTEHLSVDTVAVFRRVYPRWCTDRIFEATIEGTWSDNFGNTWQFERESGDSYSVVPTLIDASGKKYTGKYVSAGVGDGTETVSFSGFEDGDVSIYGATIDSFDGTSFSFTQRSGAPLILTRE